MKEEHIDEIKDAIWDLKANKITPEKALEIINGKVSLGLLTKKEIIDGMIDKPKEKEPSTATLEELEKQIRHIVGFYRSAALCGEEISDATHADFLSRMNRALAHLSALLKEKDEKMDWKEKWKKLHSEFTELMQEKSELQSQLKEKDEKIKEIEKINKENGELYESIMQQANNKIQELRAWKESAMEIMSPLQDIGKALGIKLGESIHDKILPAIKELKEQNELMQFGDNPIIQELKLELKEKKEFLKNAVELCCFISDDGEPVDGFRFREIASELKRLLQSKTEQNKQNV